MITFSSRIDLDSYEEYRKQTTASLKNQKLAVAVSGFHIITHLQKQ